MPSSTERRSRIAVAAKRTPSGARLDLALYVYPDGRVWIQGPSIPGGGYSRTTHKAAAEDVEVMLHQAWRAIAEDS